MRVDGHEDHALQLEQAIAVLGDPSAAPYVSISLIENYWAAAFHWIAFGCQRKHGKHKENHIQLGRYLRDLGEPAIGSAWDRLENKRQGAMYSYRAAPADVSDARDDWEEIRQWARS
jgi:hypothetical protein